MKAYKTLLSYWLEILIGAVLLFWIDSVKLFLLYFLVAYLVSAEKRTDYIRKLIRVAQVANEGKLMAIIKKLKISKEELDQMGENIENNFTEEQRKSLNKDMDDLGL